MVVRKTGWVDRLQEYPDIPCDIQNAQDLPSWTYMPADAPPLVELRTRYGLDDLVSGVAELPGGLALLEWAHTVVEHDGGSLNPQPCNALNILDACMRDKRGVNCRMKAIVLNEVYLSLGYRSRYITCMPAVADGDCHVLVMVYIATLGRWITVDPTYNTYFTDADGTIINVLQARQVYRGGGTPGLCHIERPLDARLFLDGVECGSWDEYYLVYMSKNCFRFACPVASEFGCDSSQNARFIHLSPPGYDPTISSEYDRERCYSTHDGGLFLLPPLPA